MYDVKMGGFFCHYIHFFYVNICVVVLCGIHYLDYMGLRRRCFLYVFSILVSLICFSTVMHISYIYIYVYDDGRYDMIFSLMIGNDLVFHARRHVLGIVHLI